MAGQLRGLTPEDLLKVVEEKSSRSFKFGDGNTVLSTKAVAIPATIGNDDGLLKSVIENDLPLLLTKGSMKKINVTVDFANDKVSFLDQNVDIILTSSGHYAVPISRTEKLLDNMDSTDDSEKVFLTINNLSSESCDQKKQSSKETALPIWLFQFGKTKEIVAVC